MFIMLLTKKLIIIILIHWPVLMLVFLDETILGLCVLKESVVEC